VTKLLASLTMVLIGALVLPRVLHARWDGKEDNKPEGVLEGMTDKELFSEAFDVCLRRAMIESRGSDASDLISGNSDASDYLGLIYEVAGKKHDGIAPSWMLELTAAHTVKKCQGIYRTFLTVEEPEEPKPAKKTVRRVAKRGAPARRIDPLEQLPPWLAPQRPAPSE
jgi:hypothetical protein